MSGTRFQYGRLKNGSDLLNPKDKQEIQINSLPKSTRKDTHLFVLQFL